MFFKNGDSSWYNIGILTQSSQKGAKANLNSYNLCKYVQP